ncbi:MAG: uracil-DNA glycosylase [Candidatus Niyogibacteria bacterium]|nr:MAG: uracil-DNA glycosylase [Candidatus Niyogibacteria bacterium]
MKKIRDEIVAFKSSPLYEYRTNQKNLPVIGEGSHNAKIMFVGEAPGKNEALTGRPFCGQAGRVLDELLTSIGIERKNVYITNIVKDRPPENRDPEPEEITAYAPFLDRQIDIIRPKILVPLGRFSMCYILEKFGVNNSETISKIHGKIFDANTSYGKVKIMPMYHPAASLYHPDTRKLLEADFKKLKEVL